MKASHALFTSLAAIGLLYGCAGGSQSSNSFVPSSGTPSSNVRNFSAAVLSSLKPAHTRIPRDLYIADAGTNEVDLLRNKTYRDVGVITNGISGPQAVFLDSQGRLYVGNATTSDVTEY